MQMIKRVNRRAVVLIALAAAVSAFFDWKMLPASIIVGGVLALANLRGIHWGVRGIIDPEAARGATGRLIFFSMFRLLILIIIIALLLYLKLVNIFGVLTGLTIVFILIMLEGLKEAKGW